MGVAVTNRGSLISYSLALMATVIAGMLAAQLVLLLYADRTASAAANLGANHASLFGVAVGEGRQKALDLVGELPGLAEVEVDETYGSGTVTLTVVGKPVALLPIDLSVEATASRLLIPQAGD